MKRRYDHTFIFNQQAYLLLFSTNLEQNCYFSQNIFYYCFYISSNSSYILFEPGVWNLPQPIDTYPTDFLLKTFIGYIRDVKKFDN